MPNLSTPISANYRGWFLDQLNDQLEAYHDSTIFLRATTAGAVTIPSSSLTVTTGGVTVTAGGLTVTAGGVAVAASGIYVAAGRITETLTVVDDDSTDMTLAAADILAGINVHTTETGPGDVTTDSAANIISTVPLAVNDQCVVSYYINDGNQAATFVAGDNITIADAGNTVLADEAAILLWRRTSGTAVTLYIVTS